jgi:hypothetical protein
LGVVKGGIFICGGGGGWDVSLLSFSCTADALVLICGAPLALESCGILCLGGGTATYCGSADVTSQ